MKLLNSLFVLYLIVFFPQIAFGGVIYNQTTKVGINTPTLPADVQVIVGKDGIIGIAQGTSPEFKRSILFDQEGNIYITKEGKSWTITKYNQIQTED